MLISLNELHFDGSLEMTPQKQMLEMTLSALYCVKNHTLIYFCLIFIQHNIEFYSIMCRQDRHLLCTSQIWPLRNSRNIVRILKEGQNNSCLQVSTYQTDRMKASLFFLSYMQSAACGSKVTSAHHPEHTICMVKHGGGSITVLECISSGWTGIWSELARRESYKTVWRLSANSKEVQLNWLHETIFCKVWKEEREHFKVSKCVKLMDIPPKKLVLRRVNSA